jgi:hypothetical protein
MANSKSPAPAAATAPDAINKSATKQSAAVAAAGASASKNKGSSSSAWLSPMSVAALVLLLSVALQLVGPSSVPSLTGPPHARKPFRSFSAFYPFYTSEHSDRVNRQLHFVGTSLVLLLFACFPRSLPSVLLATVVGMVACPLLAGLSHGFVEFGLVLLVFLVAHKLSTGRLGVAVLVPLIGYSFAWVGHFFHEHNRPATFIYPTYSLLGDFTMWGRIVVGQEGF